MRRRRRVARRLRDATRAQGRSRAGRSSRVLVERREAALAERLRRSPASACRYSATGRAATGSPTSSPTTSRGRADRPTSSALLEVERATGSSPRGSSSPRTTRSTPQLLDRDPRGGLRDRAPRPAPRRAAVREPRHFEDQLPRIHRHLREWGAEGFRSPGAHRHAGWMPELGVPLRLLVPRHGSVRRRSRVAAARSCRTSSATSWSCRSRCAGPHAVRDPARARDRLWREKAAWIARHGGLVTVLVHPDYAETAERLRHYDELLGFLAGWAAAGTRSPATWRGGGGERAALEAPLAGGPASRRRGRRGRARRCGGPRSGTGEIVMRAGGAHARI